MRELPPQSQMIKPCSVEWRLFVFQVLNNEKELIFEATPFVTFSQLCVWMDFDLPCHCHLLYGNELLLIFLDLLCFCSQENGDASNKVYVGGIPYYSTEDDIRSYFDSCGTITEVDCMTFPESGKFRGIAIISFKVGIHLDWFRCSNHV